VRVIGGGVRGTADVQRSNLLGLLLHLFRSRLTQLLIIYTTQIMSRTIGHVRVLRKGRAVSLKVGSVVPTSHVSQNQV
jgi:hypothetical protein